MTDKDTIAALRKREIEYLLEIKALNEEIDRLKAREKEAMDLVADLLDLVVAKNRGFDDIEVQRADAFLSEQEPKTDGKGRSHE